MDFNNLWKENRNKFDFTKDLAKAMYEAGQQGKQAEIDVLQKRIDIALRHLEDHEGYDDLTHAIKILKGELK